MKKVRSMEKKDQSVKVRDIGLLALLSRGSFNQIWVCVTDDFLKRVECFCKWRSNCGGGSCNLEVVDDARHNCNRGTIFKLDFEKADGVSTSFWIRL